MADLKKRVLTLITGKKIELFGNSLAIGRSLEIAEGYAPNVLARVQVLDKNLNFKTRFSASMNRPAGIAISGTTLYVVNRNGDNAQRFSLSNN